MDGIPLFPSLLSASLDACLAGQFNKKSPMPSRLARRRSSRKKKKKKKKRMGEFKGHESRCFYSPLIVKPFVGFRRKPHRSAMDGCEWSMHCRQEARKETIAIQIGPSMARKPECVV